MQHRGRGFVLLGQKAEFLFLGLGSRDALAHSNLTSARLQSFPRPSTSSTLSPDLTAAASTARVAALMRLRLMMLLIDRDAGLADTQR